MEADKEMFIVAMEMKRVLIQWFRRDITDDECKARKKLLLNKYKDLVRASGGEQKILC